LSTGQVRKEDGLSLCDLDERARARAVDRARAIIDLAARLGAQVNIGTLRGPLPVGPSREPSRAAARASLQALLAHARGLGVRLALEPQSRQVINWLNTVGEARAFIAGLDPAPGLLLDVYHAFLEEPSLFAAIIDAAPLLTLVQVSDSNRLPPGCGHLPFGDVLRVLAAVGYRGFLAVEALQQPTPPEAAARAARHLLALLEQIASERSPTP
jgi:sugar phosphate isomerase/epimerase